MNIVQTKQIAIVDFLLAIGIRPSKETVSSAWYHAPYREDRTPSFKVNKNRNIWFDFGTAQSGDIIDLAVLMYRTHDISRVLKMIEQAAPVAPTKVRTYLPERRDVSSVSTFRNLQVKDLESFPLLSYLEKRGIDPMVARKECREVHYTCHGKTYFAIAFPNMAGGYEIRNPYYKGAIAPKDVSWMLNGSDTVCLFEGFMDYLSFLTMRKQGRISASLGQPDLLVLNSVNNLPRTFSRLKTYKKQYCYLDNDDAGRRAVMILREIMGKRVFDVMEREPLYKDLNDLLVGKMKMP